MAKKYINWKTKGMNRDMSVSAFNPEFAFENVNLRLATNEGNTTMSWVNERGTKELILHIYDDPTTWDDEDTPDYTETIQGTPIGTAIINHKLVLFTTGTIDHIYTFEKYNGSKHNWDFIGKHIFGGKLNFDVKHPIETLVSYESDTIQKVYWVDGKNQPRVINVSPSVEDKIYYYNDTTFDFIPTLKLQESFRVCQIFGSGEFPAGVIQYAFTYYNKYMQESNIVEVSPLYYISYKDRAGSPGEKIANSFKLSIESLDDSFDYIRIYSILRTSKDATPLVKRVQDLYIKESTKIEFIDSGNQGDVIDPTELLYKGGELITAKTIEQKDNTLFLGNVSSSSLSLEFGKEIRNLTGVSKENALANKYVEIVPVQKKYSIIANDYYTDVNVLDGSSYNWQGCTGFKAWEYYRLGIQFQHETGKWSEPIWVGDKQCNSTPSCITNGNEATFYVPGFDLVIDTSKFDPDFFKKLYDAGYKKVRPLFAVPGVQDRTVICQGVGCPTMYRKSDRDSGLNNVASWLFRVPGTYDSRYDLNIPNNKYGTGYTGGGIISYKDTLYSQYYSSPAGNKVGVSVWKTNGKVQYTVSPCLSSTEVMGYFDSDNRFVIDNQVFTLNSPDVEFDTFCNAMDFTGCKVRRVGYNNLRYTYGDISIQTSSPTIGADSDGFTHRLIKAPGQGALVSGLFYKDYVVDDTDPVSSYRENSTLPVYFPVYMWHKKGSLNNDVKRDGQSAVLLKKKISNHRMGGLCSYTTSQAQTDIAVSDIKLFYSDQLSIIKVNGKTYQGNVDTMVMPDSSSSHYIAGNPTNNTTNISYKEKCYYKLSYAKAETGDSSTTSYTNIGIHKLETPTSPTSEDQIKWTYYTSNIGDKTKGYAMWKEGISIKYKSTPHLVIATNGDFLYPSSNPYGTGELPLLEVYKDYNKDTLYGGTSDEALQANTWIPCGETVLFHKDTAYLRIGYTHGDTYLQKVECLKTYPFTQEDINQVIEVASFICESRVNMKGRYDRNSRQISCLNMTPQNFNLINPVYTQMNNFFSYKILPQNSHDNTSFYNSITWTKAKENGADVDLWTNITLGSILELDGNKGKLNKLIRFNDQLLAFQDTGISQILYNENTQISTTEGVPIEIANSGKVQGKRYISDTVGCTNKWSICNTPSGIYFMDSNGKSIYLFNGQLNNLSTAGGFNSWAKQNIPSEDTSWNPEDFDNFVTYYDKLNQDVLFINRDTALAYSEKFNCFTSFYDYGMAPYFQYLDDMGIWIKDGELWQHQAGYYCKFFNENRPFSMTLIGNQEPQIDKIFTNLEFRACVEEEGIYNKRTDKFTPNLPFDTLEVWNEYQHGILSLHNRVKGEDFTHGKDSGILSRKFRMWRCDIPRDNAAVDTEAEASMGIKRFKVRPLDRIRNPWVYIKLTKDAASDGSTLYKREIHDIMATYFG